MVLYITMLKDAKQQTLVSDRVPPKGWQLWMVGIWHPDLYFTVEEEEGDVNMDYLGRNAYIRYHNHWSLVGSIFQNSFVKRSCWFK